MQGCTLSCVSLPLMYDATLFSSASVTNHLGAGPEAIKDAGLAVPAPPPAPAAVWAAPGRALQ